MPVRRQRIQRPTIESSIVTQPRIPAVCVRGGTRKGVFFVTRDLPAERVLRDRILLRVIGSPDPYGELIDSIGGATLSTSKVVSVSRSRLADGQWSVSKVMLSRSARRLMKGWVRVPQPAASE